VGEELRFLGLGLGFWFFGLVLGLLFSLLLGLLLRFLFGLFLSLLLGLLFRFLLGLFFGFFFGAELFYSGGYFIFPGEFFIFGGVVGWEIGVLKSTYGRVVWWPMRAVLEIEKKDFLRRADNFKFDLVPKLVASIL